MTELTLMAPLFHHGINSTNATVNTAFAFQQDWKLKRDGIPIVDHNSRRVDGSPSQHAESIDLDDFQRFLKATEHLDFDLMLEMKDKEGNAIKAVEAAKLYLEPWEFLMT